MEIFSEKEINGILASTPEPADEILDAILEKAMRKKGLTLKEAATLLSVKKEGQLGKLFKAAGKLKQEIYGNRLVLFAPLYLSDYCVNDCDYCGFHCRNKALQRKKLSMEEIKEQTALIMGMGHKRILVESGEHPECPIDYVCNAIRAIYDTKVGNGEIRRVNVNIAATSVDDYRKLKEVGIGTYQLFQETYHRQTYERIHKGPKADYERQITAHERAFKAGLDDYGIGVLFGLYDYRFEVLALLAHARYMEKKHGVGPHTISVPRFKPAPSVDFNPDYLVSDSDFLKLIAVLRLSVPYTGMIISTRESPQIRAMAYKLGISQTSAASKTSPGGYSTKVNCQFELSDHRPVSEVIGSICEQGMLPSFCTACYRSKRTGEAFMKLAKEGNIHYLCHPNAILTFKEFLMDYASRELRESGEKAIVRELEKIGDEERKEETKRRLKRIEKGERDLFF
ncbi:MAG: [FeFe] hydrogenase H-cluster radical SAM maturase HydG [Candidatus Micrarchaeota archaeon]